MGRNRRTHGRFQRGMIGQPATMATANDVGEEPPWEMERIVDLVRESAIFTSIPYGTRARKLADEMLLLFLDFSRIPYAEAATTDARVSQLFMQAIIDLDFGRLIGKAEMRDARTKVETAFREIIASL